MRQTQQVYEIYLTCPLNQILFLTPLLIVCRCCSIILLVSQDKRLHSNSIPVCSFLLFLSSKFQDLLMDFAQGFKCWVLPCSTGQIFSRKWHECAALNIQHSLSFSFFFYQIKILVYNLETKIYLSPVYIVLISEAGIFLTE